MFYGHLEFVGQVSLGGALFLHFTSPRDLEKRQMGWRWVGDKNDYNEQWNKSWLVFADRNADVLMADTSQRLTPVYGRLPAGEPFLVADSRALFFDLLSDSMLCELEVFAMQSSDPNDEDATSSQFISAIKEIASKKLSSGAVDGFMYYFFA